MHRLYLRLFVPTALILVLSVCAIGLYTHWRTQRDFRGYVTAEQAQVYSTQARAFATIFFLVYLRTDGWSSVQDQLRALQIDASVVIVDPQGIVVADSAGTTLGKSFSPPADAFSAPVGRLLRPRGIATLYVVPPAVSQTQQTAFLQSVDQSLLLAGLVGLVLALVLAFALDRRVARPIAAMTSAATRMRGGDLAQRVAVPSSRDEVAQLAEAFNTMASGLQEADRQRRALTADVTHELRTPLTSIRGYLEALQDGAVEPVPAVISAMHEEVMVLAGLMGDLQDLALADAGALSIHRKPQPLAPILQAAVAAQEATAVERGIALTLAPLSDPMLAAGVDELRLGQVLRNLILNALFHTPRGGTVSVAIESAADAATISVRDSGHGIPAEHLPHIFDRFYRVDPSRDRATGGAGIGLCVARGIVEAHGGTIGVESTVGSGSTFRVRLPLQAQP